jgi:hypothetical protein
LDALDCARIGQHARRSPAGGPFYPAPSTRGATRESALRLKGENGIMRKKFQARRAAGGTPWRGPGAEAGRQATCVCVSGLEGSTHARQVCFEKSTPRSPLHKCKPFLA